MKRTIFTFLLTCMAICMSAQTEELIKFGNFDQWITREVKESAIIGGNKKTLLEIGPNGKWEQNKPYTNQGGSPWATSNVLAKVAGVVKTNSSVFREKHGNGWAAKLVTHTESVKVMGMVNITVLAAGSLYTGKMMEPITSTKNPMSKISMGIPFTQRPSGIKLDYKITLSGKPNRVKQTGFSKVTTVNGIDMPEMIVVLQKRTEDAKGNITAVRVGTARYRFTKSTNGWVEDKVFPITYGNISGESWYKPYMGLITGDQTWYATNKKGKQVPITESWGTGNETPTHAVVKFDSSHGGAYIGSDGTTFCIDNVRWVFDK